MKKINLYLLLFVLLNSCFFSCNNNVVKYYNVKFKTFNSYLEKYEQERDVQKILENTKFSDLIKPKINSDITYNDKHYTFVRWSSYPVKNEREPLIEEEIISDDEKVIQKDSTLYAVYIEKKETTATFKTFKNDTYTDILIEDIFVGTRFKDVPRLNNIENIIYEGEQYEFLGWNTFNTYEEEGPITGKDVVNINSIIKEKTTYFAVYILKEGLKIKFMTYDGLNYQYVDGYKVVKRNTLIKNVEGPTHSFIEEQMKYKIKGWSITSPKSGFLHGDEALDDDVSIIKELTLYAVYVEDCLTFTALEDTQVAFNFTSDSGSSAIATLLNPVSLRYKKSTDKDGLKNYTWEGRTSIQSGTVNGDKITLKKGEKVFFNGDNESFSNDSTAYIVFTSTNKIEASGNIMSLVGDKTEIPNPGCFIRLFYDCDSLTTAPDLPATEMTTNCYRAMFKGTSITKAPELSSISLANGCYASMFQDCISLIDAPVLPATTLAEGCYQSMFSGCSSLTTAPALPADTLANNCYRAMFKETSITKAPNLSSMSLDDGCYAYMFQNCASLTEPPKLPAEIMANDCYLGMFQNSSLTVAPSLPATTLADNCYALMFYNCDYLLVMPVLPATTLAKACYYRMFYNCDSLEEVKILPASILAYQCYEEMFYECINLKDVPYNMLPAIIAVDRCYYKMFQKSGIVSAPELPAIILANMCYESMFEDCVSLTTGPEILPSLYLANRCYAFMFKDSSIEIGPTLPANIANSDAYLEMFRRAKKLTNIKIMATSFQGNNTRLGMFNGIETKGTLEVPSKATSIWEKATSIELDDCYPINWTLEAIE